MPAPKKYATRPGLLAAVLTSAFLIAGCARQQTPGYYETAPESTLSDAQHQAQGRAIQRAPSQLQLGFGDANANTSPDVSSTQPAAEAAATPRAAVIRPLREAKTFLGTTPCLRDGNQNCPATRIALTTAPSGEWRARTVQLDGTKPVTKLEQGCWVVVDNNPWRVILETESKATKARLTFVTDNVLRIDTINDIRPALDYRLTRQAEVDGIDELSGRPPLNCRQ